MQIVRVVVGVVTIFVVSVTNFLMAIALRGYICLQVSGWIEQAPIRNPFRYHILFQEERNMLIKSE